MEAEVSEILPGLYVGGFSSLKYLEALGISHVLSVLNFPIKKDLGGYFTLQIPLPDSPDANLLQYLPAAIKFMDAALGPHSAAAVAAAVDAAKAATTAATTTSSVTAASGADEKGMAGPTAAVAATTTAGANRTAATVAVAGPNPISEGSAAVAVGKSGDYPESVVARDRTAQPGGGSGGSSGCYRVLVHCQAGVSRSPAVVAGWLMRSRGLSADTALHLLASKRPGADPNEGFRAQLSLFGDMRCSLDPDHPVYKMWCLEELASRWKEQGYVDPVAFGQLPDGPTGLSEAVAAQQTLYRCRKCRQLLATSAHVMPVEVAMGHRIFRDRQKQRQMRGGGDGGGDSAAESCLFVQPMQWMSDTVTGVVAGKLHCPKCTARLGSFNWSGISNPSGAWVTPAFQLHHSKLDTILLKPLEALANVRRPVVGPVRSAVAAVAQPVGPVAPSLPTTLPAAVRRMGFGRAGAGEAEEGEEQLPELDLVSESDAPGPMATVMPTAPMDSASEPAADGGVPSAAAAAPPPPSDVMQQQQKPELRQDGCNGSGDGCSSSSRGCGDGRDGDVQTCHQGQVQLEGGRPEEDGHDMITDEQQYSSGDGGSGGGCRTAWFTHLILDCDGVMVDSEAASCEALRRAILEVTGFDVPHAFPYDYVEVFGMDVRSCLAHYRERFNRSEWEAPELLAPRVQAAKELHYKQLTEAGITAFDGAERLIRRALEAGMQVGVASSGAPEKISRNLTSSGLAPLIPLHAIVSASHVAAGKPAPDVYLAVMKATGCQDPRRALVVEDAVNGLKAARAAGMFCVGITNQLPEALMVPWADLVVEHLDQVDLVTWVPPAAAAAPVGGTAPLPADAER